MEASVLAMRGALPMMRSLHWVKPTASPYCSLLGSDPAAVGGGADPGLFPSSLTARSASARGTGPPAAGRLPGFCGRPKAVPVGVHKRRALIHKG